MSLHRLFLEIIIKYPYLVLISVFVGKLIPRGLLFLRHETLRHRAARTAAAAAATGPTVRLYSFALWKYVNL
jgi:hypothetical protein